MKIIKRKCIISRDEITNFNRAWPCSTLRATRAYWFEFDATGNLIDTDCPEHDDGPAAVAIADDCRVYLRTGDAPIWAQAVPALIPDTSRIQ